MFYNYEWIGDGFCDSYPLSSASSSSYADLNCEKYSWDGGDCCEHTCVDGPENECGSNVELADTGGYSCAGPRAPPPSPSTPPPPSCSSHCFEGYGEMIDGATADMKALCVKVEPDAQDKCKPTFTSGSAVCPNGYSVCYAPCKDKKGKWAKKKCSKIASKGKCGTKKKAKKKCKGSCPEYCPNEIA